ncbi:MAG TPA: hypothetical protein VF962_07780 [Gemmatimonadaceae bacterium]
MSEQQTCGKGLAERAALPAKLAELTAAMAAVLAFHQRSLELTDDHGRKELHAYVRLEEEYRLISSLLQSTAARMAGYRDLPMARHDIRILASAENAETFAAFVRVEREALDLLSKSIEGDERMLSQMRGASG